MVELEIGTLPKHNNGICCEIDHMFGWLWCWNVDLKLTHVAFQLGCYIKQEQLTTRICKWFDSFHLECESSQQFFQPECCNDCFYLQCCHLHQTYSCVEETVGSCNCKIYLPKLQNVFVQIVKCIFLKL